VSTDHPQLSILNPRISVLHCTESMKYHWKPPESRISRHRGDDARAGLDRHEVPMNEDNGDTQSPIASDTSASKTYRSMDDSIEDAEDSILSNLEAQSKKTRAGSDGFRPAVPGERVPLGVDSVGTAMGGSDDDDDDDEEQEDESKSQPSFAPATRRPTFKEMAKRVQAMQRLRAHVSSRSLNTTSTRSSNDEAASGHRRAKTLLASIDETSKGDDDSNRGREILTDFKTGLFATDKAPEEHHEGLNFLLNENEDEDEWMDEARGANSLAQSIGSPEAQPLLGEGSGSGGEHDEGPSLGHVLAERRRMARQRRNELRWKMVRDCFDPVKVAERTIRILFTGTFVVSIPLFVAAWVLFYYVGNPELDFMPGQATISWWFNFFGACS